MTVCVALNALSISAYFDARFSEAVAFGERAAAVADRSSTDEARRRHPYFMLGLAYVGVDRLADAESVHRKGRRLGEQLATAWDAAWYQAAAAGRAFFSGDWDDASTEAEAALAMAEETGTYLGRAYAASILGLIGLHRDDAATAKERWGDAQGALAASGPQIGGDWVPWLGALVTEAQGDPEQALVQLLSARERFEGDGMAASLLRIAADLIRLALALGRRDEAEHMACICSRLCVIAQPVSVRGMVLRCQGLASGDLGILLDAVSVYRESPRRLERAAAVEDTARALSGAGRPAEAVPLLEEALEAYEHAHAVLDEARVLALLRAAGVHKGRRGSRRRPTSGWDSLTESELRVVRLVAHGYSNPTIAATLYVSRHTVETHMRHILAKLGASSRVEVAAQAARRAHSASASHGNRGAKSASPSERR